MNKRAKELGMKNTHFENTNGLDDTVDNHVTSARDIAIMSAELISHKKILEYSAIWMDTIRNGEFGLTNTNRLVRFYKGANGLKTGSTSKAKFCISASAQRDGMTLICVIMAAPTRDIRNAAATALLDWGFSNYAVYNVSECEISSIDVKGGIKNSCKIKCIPIKFVVKKENEKKIRFETEIPNYVSAPLKQGDRVGKINYYYEDELLGSSNILITESVNKINFWYLLLSFFSKTALI